ncbi:MAG: hypothetical protein AUG49_13055 [Catenulispora sp. 13_1_20CM_3_70_7]|nr:MAG: hypothetical protein AUG49_13055 [Catenulispora sp. 13_1_20CM_3_70_7]
MNLSNLLTAAVPAVFVICFTVAVFTACLSTDPGRRRDALRVLDKLSDLVSRISGKGCKH